MSAYPFAQCLERDQEDSSATSVSTAVPMQISPRLCSLCYLALSQHASHLQHVEMAKQGKRGSWCVQARGEIRLRSVPEDLFEGPAASLPDLGVNVLLSASCDAPLEVCVERETGAAGLLALEAVGSWVSKMPE